MVSAAQTPSVRRVELGVGCVLSFLLVIREHAVLRRSLCATLTALIDPLAAPSGAIAYGLTPCPVLRAEVMWIGLLGLRLDRPGVQGRDPGAQRVQVRHRSRSFVRRDLRRGALRGDRDRARSLAPGQRLRQRRCSRTSRHRFAAPSDCADHFMIIRSARKQRRDLLIDLAFQPNKACMRLHRLRSAAAPSGSGRRGSGW